MSSEHEKMIEDCQERQSHLSDWEISFMDSLSNRLGRGETLTDKQSGALDSIWERVTYNG